jgi:hypothetical protein
MQVPVLLVFTLSASSLMAQPMTKVVDVHGVETTKRELMSNNRRELILIDRTLSGCPGDWAMVGHESFAVEIMTAIA